MKMVAKRAGVSPSTVSRALSGKIPVDEKTRERIMKAVKELNYYPNILAKGLKEGKTDTIALIVPNIQYPIFPLIAKGAEDIARKKGYTLILCNTDEDHEVEKEYISKLRTRWVDGLILATAITKSAHILELKESGFPVVLALRTLGDLVDAVAIDNYKAAFRAVSYLIETGHDRIGIINGSLETSLYRQRYEGYKAALRKAGMKYTEDFVIQGDSLDTGLYDIVHKKLASGIEFDAIFATSDPKAFIASNALKEFGIKIPQDISLMGFDNIEMSMYMDPPLTTTSQPLYEVGAKAAQKLIAMIKNGGNAPPTTDYLPTELIIRKSTKKAASGK